jgi:hypothetical protein
LVAVKTFAPIIGASPSERSYRTLFAELSLNLRVHLHTPLRKPCKQLFVVR